MFGGTTDSRRFRNFRAKFGSLLGNVVSLLSRNEKLSLEELSALLSESEVLERIRIGDEWLLESPARNVTVLVAEEGQAKGLAPENILDPEFIDSHQSALPQSDRKAWVGTTLGMLSATLGISLKEVLGTVSLETLEKAFASYHIASFSLFLEDHVLSFARLPEVAVDNIVIISDRHRREVLQTLAIAPEFKGSIGISNTPEALGYAALLADADSFDGKIVNRPDDMLRLDLKPNLIINGQTVLEASWENRIATIPLYAGPLDKITSSRRPAIHREIVADIQAQKFPLLVLIPSDIEIQQAKFRIPEHLTGYFKQGALLELGEMLDKYERL